MLDAARTVEELSEVEDVTYATRVVDTLVGEEVEDRVELLDVIC